MVEKKHIIIPLAVLVAGLVAFFVFFQSEEAKVKKQFKLLAENIEKEPGENPIIAAAKTKNIKEMIIDPCHVIAPAYSTSKLISSAELSQYAFVRRTKFLKISMKFYDFTIEFPDKNTGRVSLTALMEGRLSSNELVEEIHELKCIMQKSKDVWRLKEIEVVEVLQK